VEKSHPVFKTFRQIQKVKNELDFEFDAVKAFVRSNNRRLNVIRLRYISEYEKIIRIQESFSKHGIKPLSATIKLVNNKLHVILNKVFCMSKLIEGLYLDANEKNHFCLEIPGELNFEKFNKVTQKVRHNWFESKFDAAFGYYLQ